MKWLIASVDSTLVGLCAIFFVATFIRSAFGFGEALIAVPLAAFLLPIDVAAPVAVLVSIAIAAVVVAQDWRQIHLRDASKLVGYTLFGIPIGLVLLIAVPEWIVKGTLAVVVIAFGVYSLLSRRRVALSNDRWTWAFGLSAGVLGGAYGMNGPPLVVYGALQGWSPQHFRATLQGYFLPASTIGMTGYWLAGLWTPQVTYYFLITLLPVLAAIFLGRWTNRRLPAAAFLRYVYIGLIIVGILLLVG